MPRRLKRPEPPKPSTKTLDDVVHCEETGNHEIHPTVWPPRIGQSNPAGETSGQCVKCECWVIVYPDNDPDRTGIEVVPPQPKKVPA